jgi:peroxiredoxin Q/BCP
VTLKNQDDKPVDLSQFRGQKNVLLVMYPGDDTPGCTVQLCNLRDDYAAIKKLDTVVFGVNHAEAKKHKKFQTKYGYPFDLLVDEGRGLITKFGALKKFFKALVTKRTVAIIDKSGIIRYVKSGMPSDEELIKEIAAL